MQPILAKFILSGALALGAGPGQDLPPMVAATTDAKGPEVVQVLETYETAEWPPCTVYSCPGPQVTVRARPRFCALPGVYLVTLRLSVLAQAPASGKVWLERPGSAELLAAFEAGPGAPAYVAASLPTAAAGDCYRVRIDTNGPAELVPDPGASFVTWSR